jgi:D-ornithine 4,5-aminomutase subunit alpha
MEKLEKRNDDFQDRRKHLQGLNDQELKDYFWDLAELAVNPLIELARNNTSPAIERSVLLRMGFSSLEAKALVDRVIDHNLMGKGTGNVVYRYSIIKKMDIRSAGLNLIKDQDWDLVIKTFEVGNA